MDFMQVEPGMHDDYLALEKAWKKLHTASKKAGKISGWTLERVVSPGGSSMAYNYITRQRLDGEKQLAGYLSGTNMPDNWTSLLTPDELALVMRTSEIRTWVKLEVWSSVDRVMAEKMENAKVNTFNYFSVPEGKTNEDHYQMERDIWMPVHSQRVNSGTMKGWVLLDLVMPMGNTQPYSCATVDIYTDMEQMLAPFLEDTFCQSPSGEKHR